jgi:DNA-binding NarL/FixJ family response regulator
MISVVVVEDLEDYRNGLMNLINWLNGYTCTGAYTNAEEAIKDLPALNPDIDLRATAELIMKTMLVFMHDVHGLWKMKKFLKH